MGFVDRSWLVRSFCDSPVDFALMTATLLALGFAVGRHRGGRVVESRISDALASVRRYAGVDSVERLLAEAISADREISGLEDEVKMLREDGRRAESALNAELSSQRTVIEHLKISLATVGFSGERIDRAAKGETLTRKDVVDIIHEEIQPIPAEEIDAIVNEAFGHVRSDSANAKRRR